MRIRSATRGWTACWPTGARAENAFTSIDHWHRTVVTVSEVQKGSRGDDVNGQIRCQGMSGIILSDIEKAYGDVKVIHSVNIAVDHGEFVVMVGPSGCGKSTLLRMIAGLEEITAGKISIGGRIVNDVHPKNRDIAMVFQNYGLYPHMTVAQNMGFALKMRGEAKSVIDTRVTEAAEILALSPLLDRKPGQLSGGQRQRVAMGRAIVREPAAFLFDEPLSNLDAKLRVVMRSEIKSLHQRLGVTIVYVTHDQIEAMTMADRIVVMHEGVVQQFGTPLELYDQPNNRFVAGFIGSPAMNLIEGVVEGEVSLRTKDGDCLSLPPSTLAGLPKGKRITLGFRPEHLAAADDGFDCKITQIEPTGAETHVRAQLGAASIVAVIRDRLPLAVGDRVRLSVASGMFHFFDTETGKRHAA